MKLLSVLLLGLTAGLAAAKTHAGDHNMTTTVQHEKYDTAVASAEATSTATCSSQKNSSMITGGKVLLSVVTEPLPNAALAVQICCQIANGLD